MQTINIVYFVCIINEMFEKEN